MHKNNNNIKRFELALFTHAFCYLIINYLTFSRYNFFLEISFSAFGVRVRFSK